MSGQKPAAWTAPEPRMLPDLRARLVEHTRSPLSVMTLASTLATGRSTVTPIVDGAGRHASHIAAQMLSDAESDRLSSGALYYATADTTALAIAAAATPPVEAITAARLPSPAGFMLFATPIGDYEISLTRALAGVVTPLVDATARIPIVAASWSLWSVANACAAIQAPVRWIHPKPGGELLQLPEDYQGIWITFYTDAGAAHSDLPPDQPLAKLPDGSTATAGQLAFAPSATLSWDNEMILRLGARFEPLEAQGTTQQWAQVVYTAWQLMSQPGTPLTDLDELPRERHGRRRDQRAGIIDPGAVRVVRLHHQDRDATDPSADGPIGGTTGREFTCRWPVRAHRRHICLHPRAHATGDCTHEDRIIPAHIKGPAGKPLRLGRTVNLWDQLHETVEGGQSDVNPPSVVEPRSTVNNM